MIVNVKGMNASQIVNKLQEVGVNIDLEGLMRQTGQPADALPAYYNVENGSITNSSDDYGSLIPTTEGVRKPIRRDLVTNGQTLQSENPLGGQQPTTPEEPGLWKSFLGVGAEMWDDVTGAYDVASQALRSPIIGETIEGKPRQPRVDLDVAPAVQTAQTEEQLAERAELEAMNLAQPTPAGILQAPKLPEPKAAVPQRVMRGTEDDVPGGELVAPVAQTPPVVEQRVRQVQEEVGLAIPTEMGKNIYQETIDFIDTLIPAGTDEGGYQLFGTEKQDYENLANKINEDIDRYDVAIREIAEEKQKPTFEGSNKFWAVIAAAVGAAGATLGRTPNYAMQVIESAIDADAKKFLASQAVRMKSAEMQRLGLIQRRGEILQYAQNHVLKTIQMSSLRLQSATAKANIQRLSDSLTQAQETEDNNYQLALTSILKDIVVSTNAYQATLSSKERELYVPGMMLKSGDGRTNTYAGFVARSLREAREIRDKSAIYLRADRKLTRLTELLERKERFMPSAWSATAQEIESLGAQLENDFKILNNYGANYSLREVQLNTAQIPMTRDAGFIDKIMKAQQMVGTFRKQINYDYSTLVEAQGTSPTMLQVPGQSRTPVPGLKVVNTP